MKKQDNAFSFMARHWPKAALVLTAAGIMTGLTVATIDEESDAQEKMAAQRTTQDELLRQYDFTPIVLDKTVQGKDAGLYAMTMPGPAEGLRCVVRVEDTADEKRDIMLEHCSEGTVAIPAEAGAAMTLPDLPDDVLGAHRVDTLILDSVLDGKAPGLYGFRLAAKKDSFYCIARVEDMAGERVDILPGYCLLLPAP